MARTTGLKSVMLICVAIVLSGCMSMGGLREGEQRIVEVSHDKKPAWLTKTPKRNDTVFFIGTRTEARRLEDGEKDSRMASVGEAAEAIQTQILSIYESARSETGVDDASYGTAIREGLVARAKGTVRGAHEQEIYWEKIETVRNGEIRYFFNVSVLTGIPTEELRLSLSQELRKQTEENVTAGDKAAQAFIGKLEEAFEDASFD